MADGPPIGFHDASAQRPVVVWMPRRRWNSLRQRSREVDGIAYDRCPLGHFVLFANLGEEGHYVRFVGGRATTANLQRAEAEWLTWWRTRRI